jgi:hypothetical protein
MNVKTGQQQWLSDEASALQVIEHEDQNGHRVYILAPTAAEEQAAMEAD